MHLEQYEPGRNFGHKSIEEPPTKIDADLAELGVDKKQLTAEVLQRLEYLSNTNFMEEIRVSLKATDTLLDYMAAQGETITAEMRQHIKQAEYFSDIGKTGPAEQYSTKEQRRFMTELYEIHNIDTSKGMPTVGQVIEQYPEHFTAPIHELREIVASFNFPENLRTPMNVLWGMHVHYTYELLRHTNLPKETVAIAAMHHFVEGIIPGNIKPKESDEYVQPFGTKTHFGTEEIVVMLLDKYHAFQHRTPETNPPLPHAETMKHLRTFFERKAATQAVDPRIMKVLQFVDSAFTQVA